MHRRSLVFVLMGVMLAIAPIASAKTVTIATYNILNLFDVFDNPYTDDESTPVKPRSEIEQVAQVIRQLDADVIVLQEVENEQVLTAMVDAFLPDMGYDYIAAPPGNDGRGITLGVLSRKPIVKLTSYRWQPVVHPGEPKTHHFARDLLHATIQATEQSTLEVFVVHLKSKSSRKNDPKSVGWRSAEATKARDIIAHLEQQNPNLLGIIMGDFNSKLEDPASQIVFAPVDGKPVLYDVMANLPLTQRITYPSTRYPNSVIDYMGVTAALRDKLVPDSAKVFPQSDITQGSDHLPLTAQFDLP